MPSKLLNFDFIVNMFQLCQQKSKWFTEQFAMLLRKMKQILKISFVLLIHLNQFSKQEYCSPKRFRYVAL